MARHNELGKWGEQLAVDLLVTKGYAIVERNWRAGNLEVDIVAMKDNRIVFVEVKTRSSEFVDPLDAIDRRRVSRIVRAANSYVKAYNIPHEVQFDVIIIIGTPESGNMPQVEHIPDAFLPPLRTIR
ncbi:MAG: YraN family protein [Muribaculaceae bacterium]|nr:YraN family protein [Muribaculaceae bacterium]